MKNPAAFIACLTVILLCAGAAIYFFGVPLLNTSQVGCRVGGGKTLGCSSPFGTFVTVILGLLVLSVAVAWNKFGR
jgi:uncharacterized membrane protein